MSKTKTVYQTNHEGFFVGETLAHQDPRNESRWLIPAGAVEEEPPKGKANEIAQYVDGKWKLISKKEEKAEEKANVFEEKEEVKPLKKKKKTKS